MVNKEIHEIERPSKNAQEDLKDNFWEELLITETEERILNGISYSKVEIKRK